MLAILAFNLLVFLFACAGMMIVFLGGSGYLPVLLVLLTLSLPASLLSAGYGWGWFAKRHSARRALGAAWQHIPQWLAVAFWLGVALAACGEFALLITLQLAEAAPRPWQHLPVLAGLMAAFGFILVYAVRAARKT